MPELRHTVYVKRIEAMRFLGIGRRQFEKLVDAGVLTFKHFVFDRRTKRPLDRGMVVRADVIRLADEGVGKTERKQA